MAFVNMGVAHGPMGFPHMGVAHGPPPANAWVIPGWSVQGRQEDHMITMRFENMRIDTTATPQKEVKTGYLPRSLGFLVAGELTPGKPIRRLSGREAVNVPVDCPLVRYRAPLQDNDGLPFSSMHQALRTRRNYRKLRKLAPIMLMPIEIFELIHGHLDLYDEYVLSSVCKTLRNMFHRDWEQHFSTLTIEAKAAFTHKIVGQAISHRVCGDCGRLHANNQFDCPWPFGPEIARCPLGAAPGSQHMATIDTRRFFTLTEAQVQTALRLHNAGSARTNLETKHLECLLPRFQMKQPGFFNFTAQTKIVTERNGSHHYVLQMNWDVAVRPRHCRRLFGLQSPLSGAPCCQHISICKTVKRDFHPAHPFMMRDRRIQGSLGELETAFVNASETWTPGSCKFCPTDWAVSYRNGWRRLQVYRDLGTLRSPCDQETLRLCGNTAHPELRKTDSKMLKYKQGDAAGLFNMS